MKINVKYIVASILLGLASQWVFSFVKLGEFKTVGFPLQVVEYKGTICCLTRNYRGDGYVPNSLEFYELSSESKYKLKHRLYVKTGIRRIKIFEDKLFLSMTMPSWSGVKSYLESEEKSDFESYQEYPFSQNADRDFFKDIFLIGLKGGILDDFVCASGVLYMNPTEGPLTRIDLATPKVLETPTLSGFKELDHDESNKFSNLWIFAYDGNLLACGHQYVDESKEKIKYFLNLYDPKSLHVIKTYPAFKEFPVNKPFPSRECYQTKTKAFLDGDRFYFLYGKETRIEVDLRTGKQKSILISRRKDDGELEQITRIFDIRNNIAYASLGYLGHGKSLAVLIDEPSAAFYSLATDPTDNYFLQVSEGEDHKVTVYSSLPSLNNIVHKIGKRDEFLESILRACYSSSEDKKEIAPEFQEVLESSAAISFMNILNKYTKRTDFLESTLKESYFSFEDRCKKKIASDLEEALKSNAASEEKSVLSSDNKPDGDSLDLLAQLPLEVLLCCCENLDLASIRCLRQTSKSMNKLLGEILPKSKYFQELKKQYLGEKVRWSWLALDSNNHEQLVRELCVAIKKQDPVALWIGRELLAREKGEKQTGK